MERLTYWNCKDKNSALPVAINEIGDTVPLEDICAKLAIYEDAEEQKISEKLALAMRAGARAIKQNKRLSGTTYVYDVFGDFGEPKEISYYEASEILLEEAEKVLEAMVNVD